MVGVGVGSRIFLSLNLLIIIWYIFYVYLYIYAKGTVAKQKSYGFKIFEKLEVGIFFFKTSKFDSKSPLVIVKLGVDFRKTVLPAQILNFFFWTPNFTKLLNP